MNANELPLQELFTRLQEAGLALGIYEYQLLLRSLQAGFGISDKTALKHLCQTLWVKSVEEKSIFEYHFKKVMGSEPVIPTLEKLVKPSRRRKFSRILPYIIIGLLGFAICLGLERTQQKPILETIPNTTATPTPIPIETPSLKKQIAQTDLIFLSFLFFVVFIAGYIFFWWIFKRNTQQQFVYNSSVANKNQNRNSSSNHAKLVHTTQITPTAVDQIQIVTQRTLAKAKNHHIPDSKFFLNNEYFPFNKRQMKQIWRYLRSPIRDGLSTRLDVKATVDQIGRQGLLLKPVMLSRRVNRAKLLLLIDQDGSMVPFHGLSQQLAETAWQGGYLSRTGIYYFHNCPVKYLYRDSYHQEGELVSDIITQVCSERTAVLIFNDAGAARGGYNKERYKLTKEFLVQLKQRVCHITWLNPMTKKRWLTTTASEIAHLVPMFELNRQGLQNAMNVLRGSAKLEGRRT